MLRRRHILRMLGDSGCKVACLSIGPCASGISRTCVNGKHMHGHSGLIAVGGSSVRLCCALVACAALVLRIGAVTSRTRRLGHRIALHTCAHLSMQSYPRQDWCRVDLRIHRPGQLFDRTTCSRVFFSVHDGRHAPAATRVPHLVTGTAPPSPWWKGLGSRVVQTPSGLVK